jgi:hypothetical protein
MNEKIVDLILVCDADPDRERFGAPACKEGGPLVWSGLERGIPRWREAMTEFSDAFGDQPKCSWLIRADEQIEMAMGSMGAAYLKHKSLWEACRDAGDELGWHPHYWRWTSKACWEQESTDAIWQKQMLKKAHEQLRQHIDLKTVKTGWCFMNNLTMTTFAECGLLSDVSAMPQQRYEPRPSRGKPYYGAYDWSSTHHQPYRPDLKNYKIGTDDLVSHNLLEVPVSVGRSRAVSAVESLVLALRRRQWPKQPQEQAWVSLKITFHGLLFAQLFKGALEPVLSMDQPYLHCYFHPDELLPHDAEWRQPYGLRHVKANLKLVMKSLAARGYQVRFSTVDEFRRRRLERLD